MVAQHRHGVLGAAPEVVGDRETGEGRGGREQEQSEDQHASHPLDIGSSVRLLGVLPVVRDVPFLRVPNREETCREETCREETCREELAGGPSAGGSPAAVSPPVAV
ncbi:hypothetical protein GCM10018782_47560 [Streptomyces griseoaurantiacus]|nr:hypothetical protein GCM10018782_47560 [Streptomyces griseoaurantiacus]